MGATPPASPTTTAARCQAGGQSIRRTIGILRAVSRHNAAGRRLSEIARDVDLPSPTVHRILAVLAEEAFVDYDQVEKRYRLGTELYALGSTTQEFFIRDRYHAALERIGNKTEDATYLLIRAGYDGVCIDRVLGRFPVQVLGYEIGERRVLGIGAAGNALLAFLPEKLRENIVSANAARYIKEYGIRSTMVLEGIQETRQRKYSISVHKVTSDSVGVGVPIFGISGQAVAAISVSGITSRMPVEKCHRIARLIKAEIGAIDPPPN